MLKTSQLDSSYRLPAAEEWCAAGRLRHFRITYWANKAKAAPTRTRITDIIVTAWPIVVGALLKVKAVTCGVVVAGGDLGGTMEVLTLAITAAEGRPPADTIFLHDGRCPQPVPA
jgi:hypothetical protein